MLTGDARPHIALLWPKHLEHLAPEGNTMGQGHIDPEEGVVCNCGEVLGFPTVQDEDEYLAQDSTEGPTPEPEHHYDPEPDGYVGDGRERADEASAERIRGHDPLVALASAVDTPEIGPARGPIQYDSGEPLMPCELNPVPHSAAEHSREERFKAHAQSDLRGEPADEAQAGTWTTEEHNETARLTNQREQPPGPPPAVIPERDRGVVDAEDPLTARVVTIDPTVPYGPQDVEHLLIDINGRIERGVHYQRHWEERLFSAKAAFELANARAVLEATGAADQRKAYALLECEQEYLELQLCETMVRAVRETMHNLRSLQSGYQTVARSVSESMRVPNSRP